jgi:hypothetical protein
MQPIEDKTVERLKKLLAEKKEKLEQKERLLKLKNRKAQIRRWIEIGNISSKFDLDKLDDLALQGAFAEIQEKSKHSPTLENWRQQAKSLQDVDQSKLLIIFTDEPSENLKKSLKEKQFRWNSWRKEWYGYGKKEEIETLVREHGGRVEVIKN